MVLVCWMDGDKWLCNSPLQILEIFSGRARVSTMASWVGLSVRSVDIEYDKPLRKKSQHSGQQQRSSMDFCGEAGFVLSGFTSKSF